MPTTPLLGITQVSASQNSKEVTINDAVLALENATNAKKDISFSAATSYALSVTEITRNFVLIAKSATAASTLNVPNTVNGTNLTRLFVVRNESGHGLTVKFATGTGTSVVIPNNQTRLLAALDGLNIIVAAEPQAAVNFVSLSDTPNTLAGVQGKFLGVNATEDALEFFDAATFPAYAGNGGKYLVVKQTEDGVEWVDAAVVAAFTDLTDVPASYTGAGGKLAAVKSDETGMEFIDPPEAEAVEFISAPRWRIRILAPGTETQVGFGEIEFLDVNGNTLSVGGTPSANTEDVGKEIEFAFDGNLAPGAGWLSEAAFVGEPQVEYLFTAPKTVRSIRLSPITNFPGYTPTRVAFDYYNGAEWIEVGDRTTAAWVEATPQTFKINGVPLSSVADAPNNGTPYVRQSGAWAAGVLEAPADGKSYARKNGAWAEAVSGVGLSEVTPVATLTLDLLATQATKFLRFETNGAKTVNVRPEATEAMPVNGEWHLYNAGTGDLTLVAGAGVTLNAPAGGSLVVPSKGVVTLKRNAADNFDVMGQTVGSGGDNTYAVPFGFSNTPNANEHLLVHVVAEAVNFPANFAGSTFTLGANPTVQHTIDIRKNSVSVGTITIAANGTVTFATSGGNPVTLAIGDRLTAIWNGTAGTSIINSAFTLLGAK